MSLVFCEWSIATTADLTSAERVELNHLVQYVEDPDGSLSFEQVHGSAQTWQRNSERTFNKGFSNAAWWLKVELRNAQPDAAERILEIAYPILDQISVYVIQDGSVRQTYLTGDSLPFHQRPILSRTFAFPLIFQSEDLVTVYIRVQTETSVQVPLTLWQKDAFFRHQTNNNFLYGFYFGGTLTLVIYNLLIFMVLRDISYLYYVGFVASAPLFFIALSGLGFQYLWSQQILWNTLAIPVFLSSLVIFGALFTRRFLELKRFSKAMDRVILAFALIGAATLLISLYLPYRVVIPVLAIIVIFACLADMSAGILAWRREVASAKFYVSAWSVFLLGSIVFSLNKLNILPSNIFTENAVQVGSILEAVLLSFALADRINFERRLRFKAQEDNLLTQIRANETLELRVAERTRELAELNQKLEELSYTDQLTQLYNRRYLDDAAAKEWHRCMRKKADFSILLLDVDHFKQVNDRFGHETGDYCLQQVASQLRESLRWCTDIVARYGGEEFCVVLPEADSTTALHVAQRILTALSRAPLRTGEGDICITASIGISSVKARQELLLRMLFTEADAALYAAKASGRNRAMRFDDVGETT